MIRHIVLWKLKEGLDPQEKDRIKEGICQGLQGLAGKIPGLLEIVVRAEGTEGSTADLMLDSLFENEEALAAYRDNPLHVEVASTRVRPFVERRLCLNFEVAEEK